VIVWGLQKVHFINTPVLSYNRQNKT